MKKKIFILTGIASFCLIMIGVIGFTYAFFTASVGGNDRASSTIVETAELKLVFSDTQKIEMNEALPGQSVTKTFTVENRGDVEIEYTIDITNLTNTFVNGDLVYSLTSTNGGATATRKAIPITSGTLETATIAPGITQTYTIEILFQETGSNQNSSQGKIFGGVLQINSNGQYTTPPPLANVLFDLETAQSDADIDYGNTSAADGTTGLYFTEDGTEGNKRVYFYRGAVEDNYLVFGDYCWRIVRTVEDGSVRLRYGGDAIQNGETYTCPQTGDIVNIASSQQYYTVRNNKSYVNYKTSGIKTVVEEWYRDNIYYKSDGVTVNTKLTNLVADASYCNDMSEPTTNYFGAFDRLTSLGTNEYNPQYKCPNPEHKYTVSKGDLTYPIGLLTVDEVAYAGGTADSANSSYYLNTGEIYWTMSPYYFFISNAFVFVVGSNGSLGRDYPDSGNAVVPVISLKAEATVKRGTGTYNDPYVIMTE